MSFFGFDKLILLLVFGISNVKPDCYENIVNYTIRSSTGDWVLDAADPTAVTVQRYNGSLSQLFTYECTRRVGLFYLINQASGNRLTFYSNSEISGLMVVTVSPPQDTLEQEWFIKSRGRIVNAGHITAIDVLSGAFGEGEVAVLGRVNGTVATQEWDLVEP